MEGLAPYAEPGYPRMAMGKSRGSRPASHEPWNKEERAILRSLDTPFRIQTFLESLPYSVDKGYRCPRSVLRDRKAQCFDGAVFAAAALHELDLRALLVDLRAVRDDDHVLAIFKRGAHFGAVAKSNVVGLRWREPVYRTLRELILSYFELYFNVEGERTLRSYSMPLDLEKLDGVDWRISDSGMEVIAQRLDSARHFALMTRAMVRSLSPIDSRTFKAGLMGARDAGLYKPKSRSLNKTGSRRGPGGMHGAKASEGRCGAIG